MKGYTSARNARALIIDSSTPGAPPARLPLPGGLGSDEAVRATIAAMIGIIEHATASILNGNAPPRAGLDILRHIYDGLDNRFFTYRADAAGEERLADPITLWNSARVGQMVYGDCDDRAMVAAVKMRVAGIPAALAVVGRDILGPYEHVFAVADTRTNRTELRDRDDPASVPGLIPLDMQEGVPLGEWPSGIERLAVFPIP